MITKTAYIHLVNTLDDNGVPFEQLIATTGRNMGGKLVRLMAGFFDEGYFSHTDVKEICQKWGELEEFADTKFEVGDYVENRPIYKN